MIEKRPANYLIHEYRKTRRGGGLAAIIHNSINLKLTNAFLSKISVMMDEIAPLKVKTVMSKKKSPWRSDPLVMKKGSADVPRENGRKLDCRFIMRYVKRD